MAATSDQKSTLTKKQATSDVNNNRQSGLDEDWRKAAASSEKAIAHYTEFDFGVTVTFTMRTSLVIPVFNGGDSLTANLQTAIAYLEARGESHEVIVVDDCSTDGSCETITHMASKCASLRPLRNDINRGKGHAVRQGVMASRGDRIVFTDTDLAYPIDQVGKILAALDAGADVAIANRVSPQSTYHMSPAFFSYLYMRHALSRIFNLAARIVLGLQVSDCQAGLKGFTRKAADLIFPRLTVEGFTFDVELLYVAKRWNLRIEEVPVDFHYFSEPSTTGFMRDSILAMRDLASVRLNAFSDRYR